MKPRRQPEIIGGKVNPDGSIWVGDGFTSRKNSTGNYTLTFPSGFRLVSIVCMSAGFFYPIVESTRTENSVVLLVSSTLGGGAVVDSSFDFVAVGVQT